MPTGDKSHAWKGGRSHDGEGYTTVYSQTRKHVREHRYVMEQYLGRKLSPNELIHHINGNKKDNRIENLQLTTRRLHPSSHKKDMSDRKCSDCGSNKTQVKKNGWIVWVRHPITKGWLCHKCYNRTLWNMTNHGL